MKSKKIPILFIACFISPFLIAAIVLRLGWLPDHTVNKGQLVNKETHIQNWQNPNGYLWTMVVVSQSGCDDFCKNQLESVKNVQLALGKKSEHVGVMLLSRNIKADLAIPVQVVNQDDLISDEIYLVDHMGLVVLSYPFSAQENLNKPVFKGMLSDIKKLLNYARSS